MKIKPQVSQKPVAVKCMVPADVLEKIVFYQKLVGASSPAYILVESTRAFLESGDREFKRAWAEHVAAGGLDVGAADGGRPVGRPTAESGGATGSTTSPQGASTRASGTSVS